MQILVISVWIIQGILIILDEFKYHHQRGLKRWERIGHPIDTFFFLIPFLYTWHFSNTAIFALFCLLSCLIITKDEFVHAKECGAHEQWLHSVLFIIHPISFIALWLAWKNGFEQIIKIQSFVIFSFMLYQIIFWNFIAGKKYETQG